MDLRVYGDEPVYLSRLHLDVFFLFPLAWTGLPWESDLHQENKCLDLKLGPHV